MFSVVHAGSLAIIQIDGATLVKRDRIIFLHIGTHKTGTTSIQHFLAKNAEELWHERILMPSAGRHLHGHHHIAWELRNDTRLEGRTGFVQQLIKELRATDLEKAVISSEDFEYLSQYPKILRGFVSLLREVGFEPVFIVFFRERHSYLTSLAAELANHGVSHTMGWYREQLAAHGAILVKKDWYFDFNRDRFVSMLTDITDAELIGLDYDACSRGAGVLPKFLETLGASEAMILRARSWPRMNVRQSSGR